MKSWTACLLAAGIIAAPAVAQVRVSQIAVAEEHACAVTANGGAKCWGLSPDGSRMIAAPEDVPGLESNVVAISAGWAFSCALRSSGAVQCWGENYNNVLGNGRGPNDPLFVNAPTTVRGLESGVVAIASSRSHSCAITQAGAVKCWGDNNGGQLGTGDMLPHPGGVVDVIGLSSGVARVALAENQTCALMSIGAIKCWGQVFASDDFGLFPITRPAPFDIQGLPSEIVDLTTQCAILSSGAMGCWDENGVVAGTPGTGDVVRVSTGLPVCQIHRGGTVLCGGELRGDGSGISGPSLPVPDLARIASMSASRSSACAVSEDGEAWCWGQNLYGLLGDGTTTNRYRPTPLVGLAGHELPPASSVWTGLWWNSSQPGWGMHVTARGLTVFAVLFTYDESGKPKWYVANDCAFLATFSSTCSSALFDVAAGPLLEAPFDPSLVRANVVGNFRLYLQTYPEDGFLLQYSVGDRRQSVTLKRQPVGAGSTPSPNYSDLWWNPAEPGWGLGITQQGTTLFLTWFLYDAAGNPVWYAASDCVLVADACSSTLYRATGTPDGQAYDASRFQLTEAGRVSLSFSGPANGVLSYTVGERSGTKAITRQLF